ncbi:MAG: hypothetical protein BJ554DRAFT_3659, partial [Olpidium bornovanus]
TDDAANAVLSHRHPAEGAESGDGAPKRAEAEPACHLLPDQGGPAAGVTARRPPPADVRPGVLPRRPPEKEQVRLS